MTIRLRNFCFTNYDMDYDYTQLIAVSSYLVYGLEECPTTKRKHHQGYCELKNQTSRTVILKLLNGMHIEKRKGTAKEAADYCKKGDDNLYSGINVTEHGEISQQGVRTDIKQSYAYAKEKKGLAVYLEEQEPNFQDIRIFQIASRTFQKDRRFKPEVYWIWGATGTGKTRYVVEKEQDLWISGKNLRWWEGYENQEATLFDDFRKDFCTFHELLRILDRYPYTAEVKGGSVKVNSPRMYITSCFHPSVVYDTREDIGQLLRRIDHIIEMSPLEGSELLITQYSQVGGNTNTPTCFLDNIYEHA